MEATAGVGAKPLAASSGVGPPAVGGGAGRVGGLAVGRAAVVVPRHRLAATGGPRARRPAAPSPADPGPDDGHEPGLRPAAARWPSSTRPWPPPAGCSVVRLAPALDATWWSSRSIHRTGTGRGAGPGAVPRPGRPAGRPAPPGRACRWPCCPTSGSGRRRARAWWSGPGRRPGPRSTRLRAAVVLDAHDEAYREERAPDLVGGRRRASSGAGATGPPVVLVTPCPPVVHDRGARGGHHRRVRSSGGAGRWSRWSTAPATIPAPGCSPSAWSGCSRSVLERPDGPGGVRPQPHRADPAAGLRPVRGAGPLHPVRWGDGPARAPAAACSAGVATSTRPPVCAVCDSTRLKSLRIGVTRATEELAALTGVEAVEVTADVGAAGRRPGPGWWSGPRPRSTG